MSALSVQILTLLPIIVGGYAEARGYGEVRAGLLASADLLGAAIACVLVYIKSGTLASRRVIALVIAVSCVSNLACTMSYSFGLVFIWRVLAGTTAGGLYALCMIAIGNSDSNTRNYGLSIAGQTLFAATYLVIVPHLVTRFGYDGVFILLTVNMAIGFAFLPSSESFQRTFRASTSAQLIDIRRPSLISPLSGILFFYVAQGAVWAFIERIGNSAGISLESIGSSLALASVAGIVAGFVTAWQALRLGLRIPLIFVFIGQSVALGVLWAHPSAQTYPFAVILYNFCWTYVVPFQMSTIVAMDNSGRSAALAPVVQTIGLAIGPTLGGMLLSENEGFYRLYAVATLLGIVSVVLLMRNAKNSKEQPIMDSV